MLFRASVLEPTEAALEAELKKQGKVAAGDEDEEMAEPGGAGAVFNFDREDEDVRLAAPSCRSSPRELLLTL